MKLEWRGKLEITTKTEKFGRVVLGDVRKDRNGNWRGLYWTFAEGKPPTDNYTAYYRDPHSAARALESAVRETASDG